jgi:eukaryotic-like serine/threonine-protein kinase
VNPERWERAQELFLEALGCTSDERAALLARLGQDDPTLRDEVESLLESHDQDGILDGFGRGDEDVGAQFERISRALSERYTLEAEAGRGGMAAVYRATDFKHHRPVAIKVLHTFLAHSLGADRFLAEIETTAGLQHPHILPLFDSGEADGFLFFVMPFVEGESLRERMRRERQLPVPDAVHIATRLAEALDYAHRRGVVHRDIKPGNVLLLDGQPAISDFGIAIAFGAAADQRRTQPGYGLGTPRYMSPEQIAGDHAVGPASDIYSLGCVLHEMLVGEPPYGGHSLESVQRKLEQGPPSSARSLRSSIPPNVDAAIRKALERLPADRFRSARELAAALSDPTFRHGDPVPAGVVAARRWKSLAVSLALLLAVATGIAVWSLGRDDPPAPVERFRLTPTGGAAMLETYVGVGLDLSPDGQRLVYVGTSPDGAQSQLWLRSMGALDAASIPWTEGADNPVFSPDGSRVAFREGDDLEVVSLLGGLPTVLLDEGVTGTYIDWGSDGYIYFASDSIIARIAPDGGAPEPVTTAFAGARTRHPRALPDGRGLLVTLRRDAAAQATIGVVGPDGGAVRELLPGVSARYAPSGHLVYAMPDGLLMAVPLDLDRLEVTGEATVVLAGLDVRIPGLGAQFAISRSGALLYRTAASPEIRRPVWVDRTGAATPVDSEWSFRADVDGSSMALSPDGEDLAVSLPRGIGGGWDLWIKPVAGGEPVRLTTEGIDNRRPAWSPDGAFVYYVHNGPQGAAVHRRRANGVGDVSTVQTGLDTPAQPSEVLMSASGEWLVLRVGSTDGGSDPDIVALRIGVDSTARTLLEEDHVEWAPRLSPDDRWLAYASNETGRSEVYVRPFPDVDGGTVRVSMDGGDNPVWARSGRELFYRDGADQMIAAEVITEGGFEVQRRTVLFDAAVYLRGDGHPLYDVSPDDQRFVLLGPGTPTESPDLVLVRNWTEELRGLSPR